MNKKTIIEFDPKKVFLDLTTMPRNVNIIIIGRTGQGMSFTTRRIVDEIFGSE